MILYLSCLVGNASLNQSRYWSYTLTKKKRFQVFREMYLKKVKIDQCQSNVF